MDKLLLMDGGAPFVWRDATAKGEAQSEQSAEGVRRGDLRRRTDDRASLTVEGRAAEIMM